MTKLDEINERLHQLLPTTVYKITDHKEESFKWAANYQTDVTYLLSIIEKTEKALNRIYLACPPPLTSKFEEESEIDEYQESIVEAMLVLTELLHGPIDENL